MIPAINVALLRRLRETTRKESRDTTTKRLRQFHEASERLQRVCKEKGLEVPEMVCKR